MIDRPDCGCPCCGKTNWQTGRLAVSGHTFLPDFDSRLLFLGYDVGASVCRECGYLSHFIRMEDVEDMRQRAPRKRKEP
jgi:predicted nucleic-acid-binding Zn-ribbon protein